METVSAYEADDGVHSAANAKVAAAPLSASALLPHAVDHGTRQWPEEIEEPRAHREGSLYSAAFAAGLFGWVVQLA